MIPPGVGECALSGPKRDYAMCVAYLEHTFRGLFGVDHSTQSSVRIKSCEFYRHPIQ